MAGKKTIASGKKSAFDIIKSFNPNAEILGSTDDFKIKDYIDTGNYMLNAAMTGSLFKGVPTGRILTLAGPSGCGKTYLALSICRNAQKKGYFVVYFDSEGAIDTDFVERLGIDVNMISIIRVNTINEVSSQLANYCKAQLEQDVDDRSKFIFVLDSLGNLTSDKEMNDTLDGEKKRDMTKQQEVKALFRTNATNLAKLDTPFIVVSHIYNTLDLFSRQVVSGGTGLTYSASLTMMLNASKLDDKESDTIKDSRNGEYTKTGVLVSATPQKSRFTIPQKVYFQIPYFKAPNPYIGLERYLDWEHFGILRGELLEKKEYDKLSDSDKSSCHEMTDESGKTCYARKKDTSRYIVVEHLHKKLPVASLFTNEVLTDEVLKRVDDEVIRPLFELPDVGSNEDIKELLSE